MGVGGGGEKGTTTELFALSSASSSGRATGRAWIEAALRLSCGHGELLLLLALCLLLLLLLLLLLELVLVLLLPSPPLPSPLPPLVGSPALHG